MAATALADSSFLIALISEHDSHHKWARAQAVEYPPAWQTCEAVLSEAFHLLGPRGWPSIAALLQRGALLVRFNLGTEQNAVLALMQKYRELPMSVADACLVRMTEITADPVLLTTDSDFRLYRRHSRQTIPSAMPD
jgi:predicted nucleic acid-binding protein